MGEKCEFHDKSFDRFFGKIESMAECMDRGFDEILKQLHAGEIRFTQLEMRIAQLERQAASAGGVNWRDRWIALGFNLLQNGILVIIAMAYWASNNGYGK